MDIEKYPIPMPIPPFFANLTLIALISDYRELLNVIFDS